ncbi:hypothetical protein KC326_g7 [Hortaea werneckii]|nr:hypothetical protein KC326_g7 [Hortaea werneckii]
MNHILTLNNSPWYLKHIAVRNLDFLDRPILVIGPHTSKLINDIHTLYHMAKHRMLAVQMRCRAHYIRHTLRPTGDKKLAPVRARSSIRHAQGPLILISTRRLFLSLWAGRMRFALVSMVPSALVCITTPSAMSLLEEPAAAAFDGLDADESAFAGEDDCADSPLPHHHGEHRPSKLALAPVQLNAPSARSCREVSTSQYGKWMPSPEPQTLQLTSAAEDRFARCLKKESDSHPSLSSPSLNMASRVLKRYVDDTSLVNHQIISSRLEASKVQFTFSIRLSLHLGSASTSTMLSRSQRDQSRRHDSLNSECFLSSRSMALDNSIKLRGL